jgi:predicted GIY-YIG superfamily endonuclease
MSEEEIAMIKTQLTDRNRFLRATLRRLLSQQPVRFSEMIPGVLPEVAGVYLITKLGRKAETYYYIGRTKNIIRRLYHDHLMGSLDNATLKKYLIDSEECLTIEEAKEFIEKRCMARWIEESDYRTRGAIEGYCTAMLFPAYGIEEEH